MAVMCGASRNKFVFSNEDNLVSSWWPNMMKSLYSSSLFDDPSTGDLMKPSSVLCELLKPEALKQYVEIMNIMAGKHIDMYWTSNINKEANVYPFQRSIPWHCLAGVF